MRDEHEIEDQFSEATAQHIEHPGGKWPSMTYEQGVADALGWVLGERDEPPIAED